MHLPWAAAVVSVVSMASLTQAAECYAQSRGSYCVNKGELLSQGTPYCQNFADKQTCDWIRYPDSSGNIASIAKTGNFFTLNQCREAWNDIVNQCHGSRNGGSWTFDRVTLNINFCAW